MKYRIKYIEHQGKLDDIVFVFEKKFRILSHFLDDVDSFSKEYLEIFDNILSGRVEKDSATGNSCSFDADREKTLIEFLYPENEESESCVVNTRELRSLMEEWLQKRAEFLESKRLI